MVCPRRFVRDGLSAMICRRPGCLGLPCETDQNRAPITISDKLEVYHREPVSTTGRDGLETLPWRRLQGVPTKRGETADSAVLAE
ncbi:MAG: hypothetical protein ACODAD_15330, partial [Planctomycetota bacterium]